MISIKNLLSIFLLVSLFVACGTNSSNKGDAYYNKGQYKEAIVAYASYLENRPNNVKVLYSKGRAHEELKDFKRAEESFKHALKLDSKNTQILLSLSNLYHNNDKPELALMYADNAVSVSGAPALAYFLKARSMHKLGNVKEALREYNTAIKMSPKNGQAYYYRGMLYAATDNIGNACKDFKVAIKNDFEPAKESIKKYCR